MLTWIVQKGILTNREAVPDSTDRSQFREEIAFWEEPTPCKLCSHKKSFCALGFPGEYIWRQVFTQLVNNCVYSLSMSNLLFPPVILLEIELLWGHTFLRPPWISGFLSCSTSDVLGWIIYCWWEGGPVHCRMFSCASPPPPTRYLWHLSPSPAAKNTPRHCPVVSRGWNPFSPPWWEPVM